ncbi:MAG: aminoglycoside phosphotransferase family protein [Deltaproteobacteria bacterium]|nr:MAG: aminoglycoside phosphotransferase family protein [Deltaproteobacteria bacterium]
MARSTESVAAPEIPRALAAYGITDARVSPLPGGLIHQSFSVCAGAVEYVLQRVSPIFSPGIHDNIRAVTEHLQARGLCTFVLLPTRTGRPYADLGADGIWRLETRVPGVGFDTCDAPEQARSAAALVARFHSALDDLEHAFQPLGIRLHDTPAHLRSLEKALDAHPGHRLYDRVAALADEILCAARTLPDLTGLPRRVVHGDLKFNNVLFEGRQGSARSRAVSLIDLDTTSRIPLYAELGDAWRSWCNRRGEDSAEAELDMRLFRAAAEGYLGALSIELGAEERASLADGLDCISLELAARFAADALNERYFGWNPARFGSAGDHNWTRALGQFSLYRQARATRAERIRILGGRR